MVLGQLLISAHTWVDVLCCSILPLVNYSFSIFLLSSAVLSVLFIELLSCCFNPPPTQSLPPSIYLLPSFRRFFSFYLVPPFYLLSSSHPLKPCLFLPTSISLPPPYFFPFFSLCNYFFLSASFPVSWMNTLSPFSTTCHFYLIRPFSSLLFFFLISQFNLSIF